MSLNGEITNKIKKWVLIDNDLKKRRNKILTDGGLDYNDDFGLFLFAFVQLALQRVPKKCVLEQKWRQNNKMLKHHIKLTKTQN